MIARLAVASLAVVVLAWLGILYRDQRLVAGALKAPSPTQAESELQRGRLLNPDTGPDISRSVLLAGTGRRALAVATLQDVLRREPENLYAWSALLSLSRGRDPANTRRARAALLRLDALNRVSGSGTR